MKPEYANEVSVSISSSGTNRGETQILFRHVYRDGVTTNSENGDIIPGRAMVLRTADVASIVISREMAVILRDSLDNVIQRYGIDEGKNPGTFWNE